MPANLLSSLREAGLLGRSEVAELIPLRGGVSSDIVLVRRSEGEAFVVKRALAKLKVKDDWFANPERNRTEQAWFEYVARFAPGAVPRILHRGSDWFAMEFLGSELALWKDELLAGRARPEQAAAVGTFLGNVHRQSWGDAAARATFATGRSFYDLRIEPYLITTGKRLPELRDYFEAEAARLAETALALVHGDYSPKNLLVGDRLVVLDAEVAWFGDPAFDLAFLLTHLHLKALRQPGRATPMLTLVPAFWTSYCAALGAQADATLERRTVRLLQMILLARVHGKSPVEYLDAAQQALLTRTLAPWVPRPAETVSSFAAAWAKAIAVP
jgi:aminoglycoside phosphotransferase (APT) family kinase protein